MALELVGKIETGFVISREAGILVETTESIAGEITLSNNKNWKRNKVKSIMIQKLRKSSKIFKSGIRMLGG